MVNEVLVMMLPRMSQVYTAVIICVCVCVCVSVVNVT